MSFIFLLFSILCVCYRFMIFLILFSSFFFFFFKQKTAYEMRISDWSSDVCSSDLAGVSVVTICNYNTFQGDRDAPETPSETVSKTDARQAQDTEQRTEEIYSEPKGSSCGVSARERKPDPFPCPDGVDPIDWDGLKSNRKAERASLSEGAHRQIVNKLDRWNRDGWPPGPIVACAAERGWTTVFETDEMKGPANGKSRENQRSTGPTDPMVRAIVARQAQRRSGIEREPF